MEEKLAKMMNAVIYHTAAAQGSQRFDFVCLHAVTSCIFFSSFLAMPSLSSRTKVRLLERKGRMDLMI
ncbi:hypA-like protein [Penicillium tannophilum]|nr:hypA-like protein [Penicillium tannophilum]